ncbi:ATP-binding protein [Mesorhizobium caraganae]|uniref:ATP-binding protein n=1 Tax=Mesorhizobium caraganae TaxID=483206 RepID=UPI001939DB69|nr:ATP-binding protein [Mesorhizobium caraganae]MBM2716157.1 ATP-binding protein [Mesorhizobium caraganae]
MTFNIEIGLNAIASYRRMNYEIWYALAEFVDNSTQSYANNKDALDAAYEREGEKLEVRITYERQGNDPVLRIVDNAMGMDYAELEHALKIANPPAINTGRCRYGMGMKTSSCWIGNRWSIATKKLGDTREYTVEVDVKRIEGGDPTLDTKTIDGLSPDEHYTRIEIREHNREFKGRTIGKIKDFLKSMYRVDFRNNTLDLWYNDELLSWEEFESKLRRNRAGEPYKREFMFDIEGKIAHGWAGVLDKGARADTGFSILHADRVVKGWPDAWRPERIFGMNRNDLLNQRLLGEIHLEDFEVTHTKDNIQWYGDEEELFEKKLAQEISDLINIARTPWKDQEDGRRPSEGEIDLAISGLRDELMSPEMVDKISIEVLPPEEAIKESLSRIAEPVKAGRAADIQATVGDLKVWVYVVSTDIGPYDPYVVCEAGSDGKIIVIINMQHPHVSQISGEQGIMNYFRHCVYDAVAEWQAQKLRSKLDSNTIKMLKDSLLRVSLLIEQHATASEESVAE